MQALFKKTSDVPDPQFRVRPDPDQDFFFQIRIRPDPGPDFFLIKIRPDPDPDDKFC